MKHLLPLLVFAAGCSSTPQEPGIELRYRIHAKLGPEFVRALTVRAERAGVKATITADGDLLRVRLPGAKEGDVTKFAALTQSRGALDIKVVATPEAHKRYNADNVVPSGYEVLLYPDRQGDEYHIEGWLLVATESVITERDVLTAEVRQDEAHRAYVVDISLRPECARRFDEVAMTAFNEVPKGLLAILVDGNAVSVPRVVAEEFGSTVVLTGNFDKEKAEATAAAFVSGARLPAAMRLEGREAYPK